MRKIKIDVKLSFFANSIPTSNQSSGSDREFLFHISYLEERKKEKKDKNTTIFKVLSLYFWITIIYLSAERHSGPSGTVCQE